MVRTQGVKLDQILNELERWEQAFLDVANGWGSP